MPADFSVKPNTSKLVNQAGLTYREFRGTLTPRWGVVWLHIALGWLALIATNAIIILWSGRHWAIDGALFGVGSILIGFILAYLMLFLHEAVHFNLHPNRKMNDLLCNLFVSGITGQDVRNYRPIHWDHHRYLGTTMDTEITYFDALNIRFLVEAMLGIRVFKVFARRGKDHNGKRETRKRPAKSRPYVLVAGFVFNFGFLITLFYFGQWALLGAWSVGFLVFSPFFGALRQLLEHRDEDADPKVDYTSVAHGAIGRMFGDGLLASTLGGAGFNRHLLHHWEPDLSYTRLRELEEYLMDTEVAAYLRERHTTYIETFRRLFQPVWR